MFKTLLKFTFVIVINLFAFLSVGHILDVIFFGKGYFKLIFVAISIIPLIYFAHVYIKNKYSLKINTNIKENESDGK